MGIRAQPVERNRPSPEFQAALEAATRRVHSVPPIKATFLLDVSLGHGVFCLLVMRGCRASKWRLAVKPKSENLLKEALDLPPIERAALADKLLASLDKPDEAVDEVWRKEIAARLRAYRSGTAATVSAEDILAEYRAK